MVIDYSSNFFFNAHTYWLYDTVLLSLPVSMSHIAPNISFLLCYISSVPSLRKHPLQLVR